MKLVQSKSILAKLMATENLIVEQRKTRTASFDVASRVLTVPILDDNMAPELYDLFMGHEVGHALFTPPELLEQCQDQELTFSVMNVIEDARIERKMKAKYPGLKQPFIIGYKDLIDRNFFNTENTDLGQLNFIDRANMYFKLGVASGIDFTNNTEKDLIEEIIATETIQDVLTTTRNVMDYLIEEEKQNPEREQNQEFDEFDGDEDGHGGTPDQQEIESNTDKALRENQSQLFSDDNIEYYYGNVPYVNPKTLIINHHEAWAEYNHHKITAHPLNFRSHEKMATDTEILYQTFRSDSKKVVSYLVKEFELKKNAQQLKRASIAKTGEINMDTIYSYKFNEDIFKKLTTVPNGKSHGLVLFLDWSGSMQDNLHNTVKQLLNLVLFCKQVNIPYEVYAFTNRYNTAPQIPKEGDLEMFSNVNMVNMLSNKMTNTEFNFAVKSLLDISKNIGLWGFLPDCLSLGATPLNAAIVTAMHIIPKFKKDYKLEIVNTVFLTDGDSDNSYHIHYKDEHNINRIGTGNREFDIGHRNLREKSLIIRDPKSKYQETIKNVYDGRAITAAFLRMLKYNTQCNIVGFYVVNKRNNRVLDYMFPDSQIDIVRAEFKRDNYKIITNSGYDEYYLLRAEGLNIDETELTLKENASTRGLATSFAKFSKQRTTNRVILNQFIKMII